MAGDTAKIIELIDGRILIPRARGPWQTHVMNLMNSVISMLTGSGR
jgi:hypothetical protein